MPEPFAIGIDLGTTNCALAFGAPEGGPIETLPIPQVVAPGEMSSRPLLPSFLYFPAEAQFPKGSLALPWVPGASDVVGELARSQGASTPARLVGSAKSWLSHAAVDRHGEILPWQSPEEVPKVSPVQASARYLAHLRAAWEEAHPDAPLTEQDVVLTVPASFDPVARELTMEAAALAGFEEPPILLEEPQAALYDWLAQRGDAWRKDVVVGDVILVVDIGGGTTEVAVIALNGIVVSNSIRVGGDKLDQAIASYIKRKYNLLIGDRTAEELKIQLGSALPLEPSEELTMEVRGRDQVAGLPRTITVRTNEVVEAIGEPLEQIVGAVRHVLERTPPELASDIIDRGMVMTGGGALLRHIDELLTQVTGIPCFVADNPLACVAVGTGMALENLEVLKDSLADD